MVGIEMSNTEFIAISVACARSGGTVTTTGTLNSRDVADL